MKLVLESSGLQVKPTIEDDPIAYHDHLENELVANSAGSLSLMELCSIKLESETLTQIPREHEAPQPVNNTENGREFNSLNLLNTPNNNKQNEERNIKRKCISNYYVLMTASTLVAASTYTRIFNLSHSDSESTEYFSVRDIILCPDRLPNSFYSIMFMTVAFTLSMVGLVISFRSRVFLLLCLSAFFFSYTFIMKDNLPKFWVTFESFNFKISSFWLVWLYGLSLILPLVTFWLVVKLGII
ncbi:uncharacterized protein LOC114288305 [Camellia sinensis]|uniref:uncharacterized protein LOC114288305 n=1 Tax=Camellia sinensis TaxID=4442 RepID=UPI001035B269|nr:uncharacterized protein LOC114288305 [Camellia sinensis]